MTNRLTAPVSFKAHSAVPALPAGGVIALIAPAGPAELDLNLATQWMHARGYQLRVYPGVWQRDAKCEVIDHNVALRLHGGACGCRWLITIRSLRCWQR